MNQFYEIISNPFFHRISLSNATPKALCEESNFPQRCISSLSLLLPLALVRPLLQQWHGHEKLDQSFTYSVGVFGWKSTNRKVLRFVYIGIPALGPNKGIKLGQIWINFYRRTFRHFVDNLCNFHRAGKIKKKGLLRSFIKFYPPSICVFFLLPLVGQRCDGTRTNSGEQLIAITFFSFSTSYVPFTLWRGCGGRGEGKQALGYRRGKKLDKFTRTMEARFHFHKQRVAFYESFFDVCVRRVRWCFVYVLHFLNILAINFVNFLAPKHARFKYLQE